MLLEIDSVLSALVYLVAGFILFIVGKLVYNLFHPGIKVNDELVEKDNLAFSSSLTGYYIGLILCIGAAIIGPSAENIWIDLMDIGLYGGLGIILLNVAAIFNDVALLRQFKVKKEIIEEQNLGTGIVEAANFIATGLIVQGAIVGEGGNLLTALGIWILGQVLLLVASWVYNLITPYNVHYEIEKGNPGVALGFGGALIAIGNLIRLGVEADWEGWSEHLLTIGFDTVVGLILLPVVRLITDKILLPGQSITDELVNQEKPNIGAGLIEGFAYVGGSVLLSWVL
ncbi:MAG TPA: DUF350 domain-containing protein [Cytophagales bacterium]|nr:DUF350 domain-containing protein [Cytophagales bacterium]HAA17589.1 DUF350 domain-containing protein [Cytophagales bacterium]HAP61667.1 DUF350 domain-containing protein [Cytophagales bacterium]